MITDYDQFFCLTITQDTMDQFFTRHIFSEHSDTKMAFFRHTYQEKINFVQDLSLPQQHILARFWEPVLLCNGHKQTFKWSYR